MTRQNLCLKLILVLGSTGPLGFFLHAHFTSGEVILLGDFESYRGYSILWDRGREVGQRHQGWVCLGESSSWLPRKAVFDSGNPNIDFRQRHKQSAIAGLVRRPTPRSLRILLSECQVKLSMKPNPGCTYGAHIYKWMTEHFLRGQRYEITNTIFAGSLAHLVLVAL